MNPIESKELLFTTENQVATITVNRPDKLNALNTAVVEGISEILDQITADRETRVVVLKGFGGKAFVAGADIGEFKEMDAFAFRSYFDKNIQMCARISNLSQPVIAAVDGFALGGGFALTLASDIVIATDRSSFGALESSVGFVGNGSHMVRMAGRHKAAELAMLGTVVDAEEAYRMFMVNKIVAPEKLEEEVQRYCEKLKRRSYYAMKMTKQTIQNALDNGLTYANNYETDAATVCFETQECKTAIDNFLNKQK